MHMVLLGESQMHVFQVEHDQRVREGNLHRLLKQARAEASKEQPKRTAVRGFIPRIAGALGLF